MKKIGIEFTFNDSFTLQDFYKITEKYPLLNLDVKQNEFMIDGRSIMGLMNLDLSKPILVRAISHDKESVKKFYDELTNCLFVGKN